MENFIEIKQGTFLGSGRERLRVLYRRAIFYDAGTVMRFASYLKSFVIYVVALKVSTVDDSSVDDSRSVGNMV